jgi:hypothetical protein
MCNKTIWKKNTVFPIQKGLSPLLFNIYINDLPKMFQQTQSHPFLLPNGTTINSLLYADELIILSPSKSGLQNYLDQIHEWCSKWLMEVNLKKQKLRFFKNTTRNYQTFISTLEIK